MAGVSTSPVPGFRSPPPSRRRFSKWWLLLTLPLVLVVVWVTVAVSALFVRESADAYVLAVESAPVPDGADRVERTVREGTFEQGPEARVSYHLPAGRTPVEACVWIVEELRSTGWTLERWGTAPGPDPNDAEAFCEQLAVPESPGAPTAVILNASRDASEPIVAVLSLASQAPGGVVLSYTSR